MSERNFVNFMHFFVVCSSNMTQCKEHDRYANFNLRPVRFCVLSGVAIGLLKSLFRSCSLLLTSTNSVSPIVYQPRRAFMSCPCHACFLHVARHICCLCVLAVFFAKWNKSITRGAKIPTARRAQASSMFSARPVWWNSKYMLGK